MAPFEYRSTLETRYGSATYTFLLDGGGRVTVAALPYAGLPESVWKLTYGNGWEAVRTYFADLGATLPYRVAAVLGSTVVPEAFQGVVGAFRRESGTGAVPDAYVAYWAKHPEYMALFDFDEGARNGVLRRLGQSAVHAKEPELAQFLPPYLHRLLAIESPEATRLIYGVFGALGNGEARDFLLESLESEGRHIYTTAILKNLSGYGDAETLARLAAVYRGGKFGDDDLPAYLHLLAHYRTPELVPHLEEILADHPYEVDGIVHALGSSGQTRAEVAHRIRARFDGEETDYYVLDRLLRAVNGLEVAAQRIDLEAMNRKAARPAFTDVPPVNWPQQLEPGWADLVRTTPADHAVAVLGEYLARPEPRLQRNALLQLKIVLAEHPPADPLPAQTEARLRELVRSRYDKVYVEVLNVLGRRSLPLRDRSAMLAAVLGVSIGSRYRFVVLTALRRIGTTPALRAQARRYLEAEIAAADTPARREQIGGWLPFVEKYLGNIEALRAQLAARGAAPNSSTP
ncbi:hypothetical protein [Lewinella sp. IMCC34183]|uniref:hypothetical protein n=1 Tax=Lewinella sp. IMCC34183 TaxID=2248762 RepID=UPI000E227D10|nr:hypothetical protein [Lewinella sp. IMCC34183]